MDLTHLPHTAAALPSRSEARVPYELKLSPQEDTHQDRVRGSDSDEPRRPPRALRQARKRAQPLLNRLEWNPHDPTGTLDSVDGLWGEVDTEVTDGAGVLHLLSVNDGLTSLGGLNRTAGVAVPAMDAMIMAEHMVPPP